MYRLFLRLLFLLPPERIHHLAFTAMRLATRVPPLRTLIAKVLVVDDPVLRNTVFGVTFPAPLGLAAGFDKDAAGVNAWGPLGFGFAEIGTVTAQAQPGNPAPRLFRLPADRALINRMGFNNHGAGEAANRLRTRAHTVPIGANIGKTKVVAPADAAEDYTASARLLGPLADFVVVNVSSPNTPGLRDLQAVESLRPLLAAVLDTVHVPVLVKIAPDLSDEDVDAVADLAVELGLAGIVATNTTVRRDGLRTDPALVAEIGAGGLSGPPGRTALPRGPAPAARAGRGPAGADLGRRHRDRRAGVGADPRRRVAGAGLHRFHLRRPVLGTPRPQGSRPEGAGIRVRVDRRRGGRRRPRLIRRARIRRAGPHRRTDTPLGTGAPARFRCGAGPPNGSTARTCRAASRARSRARTR